MAQRKLIVPTTTNEPRQLTSRISHAISGGVSALPSRAKAGVMPGAKPRFSAGIHVDIAAMSTWMPAEKRGFAPGITPAFARLGNALTPPLIAWLILLVSWRGSFVVVGTISFLWAIAWGIYFRDDPA